MDVHRLSSLAETKGEMTDTE